VRWYAVNQRIASISKNGTVVPRAEGRTSIIARSGYTQREVPVTVQFYTSIEPSERSVKIAAGEVKVLTARVLDGRGELIDGAPLVWTSLDPNILEVDENGVIIALRQGVTRVFVTSKQLRADIK